MLSSISRVLSDRLRELRRVPPSGPDCFHERYHEVAAEQETEIPYAANDVWDEDLNQSGRPDLNRGPPAPEAGALTGLRYAPYVGARPRTMRP